MSSLLPANATDQERALEASVSRVSDVPIDIYKIWSPDECPDDFLSWLAWAFSVDTWSTNWSSTQKRAVVKQSFAVHQRKGTVGAVKRALESLGYMMQVIEWFDEETPGDAYTFRVLVTVVYESITTQLWTNIERIVRDTKNARSHLSVITVQRSILNVLSPVSAAAIGDSARVYPYQTTQAQVINPAVYLFGQAVGDYVTVYPNS